VLFLFFMKKYFFAGSLLSLFLLSTSFTFAAGTTTCTPVYGGGQTCVTSGNLAINKTVANPKTNEMVDSLGVNDPKYAPENVVPFRLVVTNNGGTKLSNIEVKDIFPQFVQFVTGMGSFDKNTKTLSFKIDSLNPNESKTFPVQGKIAPASQLPQDQGTVCVVNQTSASSEGQTSQDNAQFCIEKKVLPAQTKGGKEVFPLPKAQVTPPTGPEALSLLALFPLGAAGYLLRKKTNKNS